MLRKSQKSRMQDSLRRSNCRRFGRKLNGLPKGQALDLDGIPAKKIQELLADLEACGPTHLLRAEINREELGDCIGALIFATP